MKVKFYMIENNILEYENEVIDVKYIKIDCHTDDDEPVWLCEVEVENPFKLSLQEDNKKYNVMTTCWNIDEGIPSVCIDSWGCRQVTS